MQLVVLGMHRSGTSALARLLGLMGAWLGEEADFTPVRPDNPGGYWERRDVWALDEEVLAASGASWCRIAGLDLERLDATVRRGFEDRAHEIVRGLDARRPWAIKDPRLCLVLPLWRAALDAPVCLLIWRRPVQVAESLRARDGTPLPVGVALWEHHVLAALGHSRGLPRVLVAHAALIADPAGTVERLHAELEALGVRGLVVPEAATLARWIDARLHHARGGDAAEREIVTEPQRRLAAALDDGSALRLDPLPTPSLGARELLEHFDLRRERDELVARNSTLAAEHEAATRSVERVGGERDGLETRGRSLAVDLAAAQQRIEGLGDERERLEERVQVLTAERDADMRRIDELVGRHGRLEERVLALTAERERLAARAATADDALEAAAARVRDAAARLHAGAERARELGDEIRLAVARADELQALIELVLGSRRWRVGDRAGELFRQALLRPAQPPASAHAARIVGEYREWRRRALAKAGSAGARDGS